MGKQPGKRVFALLMALALVLGGIPAMTLPAMAGLTTIYVNSSTGNDTTGNGTVSTPYKTFTKGYSETPSGGVLDLTGTFTWTDADETGDAGTKGFIITKNITIQGQSDGSTVIQAASSASSADRRIFTIESAAIVMLKNLVLRYGNAPDSSDGGAISAGSATLTISGCYIHHNSARQQNGIYLSSMVSAIIENSTISDNFNNGTTQSGLMGGAIGTSSASDTGFPFIMTNCTIYNNSGIAYGGGVYLSNYGANSITNCTIANNRATDSGGGISFDSGSLLLKNTIIADNICIGDAASADLEHYSGTLIDNGNNLIGAENSDSITGTDLSSLSLDSALADNGGSMPTLALSAGSSAIDAGSTGSNGAVTVPSTDQRGLQRDANYDIGAFEYGASAPIPMVTGINPTSGSTAGGTSIAITGSNFTSGSTVSFGGTSAASVTFISATSLTAVSPAHAAGTVDVIVSTWGGTSTTSAADQFTYIDPAPTVTLSADNASIAENAGVATVTATLSAPSVSEATVTLGYTGTATGEGTDYSASSTTITIAAGSTTGTATITAVSDTLDEVDETVIVDITGVTNANESGTQQVTVVITDDDDAPTISINDPSVAEGNAGNATLGFAVTLSAPSGKSITVDYATADDTATTAGSDYAAASGTLTFTAGETSKTVNVTVAGDTVTEPDETILLNLSNAVNATIVDNQGSGTITNDDAIPAISIHDVSTAEGDGGTSTLAFTVSLDHASASVVTVEYATAGDTATAGTDYMAATGTLTFAAGETSKTFNVTIVGDTGYEPDERFYINLSNPTNASISDNQGIGTITNDDAAPTVTLGVDNVGIDESTGVATVTATLSSASASDVTVTLGYTGSATGGGTDYTASSTTITIVAGSTSGAVTITAASDALDEANETVIVDITGVTNGTESGTQQVTTTIMDDDDAPTISVNDPSVAEGSVGNATLGFTITLSAASGQTITVDYATANGTATAGTDYTSVSGSLTFNAGETSKTVNVTVAGDTVTEPDETILLNLSNAGNATIADNQGSGTITNDDAEPAISVNDVSVVEGNAGTGTLTFTVSLDHASAASVTVDYTTADNTATAGTDYTATSGTLIFNAGVTSQTVSVTISGDTGYEPDEGFHINLANPVNAAISDSQGTGTITNDDAAPAVTLSVDNASIAENAGVATVTATLSATSASEVTVTLGYIGTATGGGTDYSSPATIAIAAGSTTGTATVAAVSDTLDEVDETVIVDITGVTNATESGTQQVTVTITDDDDAPTISVNDPSVAEGNAGSATLGFTVTLSAASGKTITVDYATADDTATTAGSDYTAATGMLTFSAGETSKTVNVTVTGDTVTEPGETILLNLSNAGNATIADNQGSGTITNDDAEPAISVNDVSVVEGNAGTGTLTFTVSLDRQSASSVTVDYTTADNTATAGTDYTATSGTLTFNAGATSQTVSVTISGDTGYEPDEGFRINLANPLNAAISDGQGIGTITNDDAAPTVTLSVDNASIAENAGVATVTATLSAASASEVTVTLGCTGTATGGGTDYSSPVTIAIAAGSTTGTATVAAVSDTLDEVDETVIVDITGVTNATESGTQQVTVTITDDDDAPTISVNDPSVAEGNAGNVTLGFTVALSTASGKTVTVDYTTADGTATTADSDYVAANGTLTFHAGETTKQVPVTVTGDTRREAGETVLLNLSNPVNATISDSQGSGTISDDETVRDATSTPIPPQSAVVEVNGEKQDAGETATETTGGTTTTTITVDDMKLNNILGQKGANATVTLPASGNPDIVVGQLTGQTVKNMETREAVLEIKTGTVSYTLPASQINIDAVSSQFGAQVALKDIKVSVRIAEPSADTVKVVEDTANKNSYQLVVKPVAFEITCTSGDTTVAVSRFNGYVERTIAIPDGIDPGKITTGIVLNADGTFSHVPTQIVMLGGKYYAKINSLTNSTYSVVYNPVIFTDMANHWAKDAVNDMGSRMVVTGIGGGLYEPERSITRAEFAAIVVRALGLQKGSMESAFGDVALTDWFNGYVDTATAYGLIRGYDSGKFGPNDTITREQAMTILARAMKLTGLNVALTDNELSALLANYTDAGLLPDYAREGAAACIKTGVLSGTTSTTLSPKDNATRSEVAVMVQRLLKKAGLI